MKKQDVKVGMCVTTTEPVEAYGSNYGPDEGTTILFKPGQIGVVGAVGVPPVRGRSSFVCVDFFDGQTNSARRAGVVYKLLKKVPDCEHPGGFWLARDGELRCNVCGKMMDQKDWEQSLRHARLTRHRPLPNEFQTKVLRVVADQEFAVRDSTVLKNLRNSQRVNPSQVGNALDRLIELRMCKSAAVASPDWFVCATDAGRAWLAVAGEGK